MGPLRAPRFFRHSRRIYRHDRKRRNSYLEGLGRFLTAAPGYGIAICAETVFLFYESSDLSSRLVELSTGDLLSGRHKRARSFRGEAECYRIDLSSTNGRIHQVAASPTKDRSLASASANNPIVLLKRYNIELVCLYLLSDQFGDPIKSFGRNKINRSIKLGSCIYSIACTVGTHSLLG